MVNEGGEYVGRVVVVGKREGKGKEKEVKEYE